VARAVIQKVEGPDHTWKLPSAVQRRLEHVHARAALDPEVRERLPDLLGAVRGLLARLERAPVVAMVRRDSVTERITLGAFDLRCALAEALGRTRTIAALPDFVHRLQRGDWAPLAEHALERRRGSIGSAMAIAMDCASGATAARHARIRREARDPANLLGDAIHAPFHPESCAPCGDVDLGDGFRGPLRSDVPVLFVSGALDARTPPENVEAIRAGFSRHAHVLVHGAGHDARELIAEEYRDLLQAFLRGETVESCEITLPLRFDAPGQEPRQGGDRAGSRN
jgi:pimeloyl-ACP methyl ester carboxylesterase